MRGNQTVTRYATILQHIKVIEPIVTQQKLRQWDWEDQIERRLYSLPFNIKGILKYFSEMLHYFLLQISRDKFLIILEPFIPFALK